MTGNAIFHFIKYFIGIDKPESQTTLAEQNCIKKYALNSNRALEIGVFEGVNTKNIAETINESATLYAIDPFFKGKLGVCYSELIAKSEFKRSKLLHKIQFIEKLSFEAINDIPDELDFIFIDGDHSLEGIQKDWAIFSKKLKQGGIIILHDTSTPAHNPRVANLGSCKYYNEYIKFDDRFNHLETVDSINVLQRK